MTNPTTQDWDSMSRLEAAADKLQRNADKLIGHLDAKAAEQAASTPKDELPSGAREAMKYIYDYDDERIDNMIGVMQYYGELDKRTRWIFRQWIALEVRLLQLGNRAKVRPVWFFEDRGVKVRHIPRLRVKPWYSDYMASGDIVTLLMTVRYDSGFYAASSETEKKREPSTSRLLKYAFAEMEEDVGAKRLLGIEHMARSLTRRARSERREMELRANIDRRSKDWNERKAARLAAMLEQLPSEDLDRLIAASESSTPSQPQPSEQFVEGETAATPAAEVTEDTTNVSAPQEQR